MTDEVKRCVEALRFKEDFECIECPIPAGNCEENCMLDVAADLIESISAELEQVKRERDAAVKDLRTHGVLCVLCLHEKKSVNEEPCKSCSHASTSNRHTNWQWHGVKEEPHD